jgi:hypothetical protein
MLCAQMAVAHGFTAHASQLLLLLLAALAVCGVLRIFYRVAMGWAAVVLGHGLQTSDSCSLLRN